MNKYLLLYIFVFFCISTNLSAQLSEIEKWYKAGAKHQTQGKYPNAINSYNAALKLCPTRLENTEGIGKKCLDCNFNLGICRQELEDYPVADNHYSVVIQAIPLDHEAFARRGDCRTQMKKLEDALLDFQRAYTIAVSQEGIASAETQYWYTHNLALAYRNVNQLKEAIKYINEAIGVYDNPDVRVEKAKLLLTIGDLKGAEQELNHLKQNISSSEYNHLKGELKLKEGKPKEALGFLGQVSNPKEAARLYQNLATCHIQLNDISSAKASIKSFKAHQGTVATQYWFAANIAFKQGDLEGALSLLDEAEAARTQYDPILSDIYLTSAAIYFRNGDFHDVIGACQAVISEREDVEAFSLLGLSYLELGQRERAAAIFANPNMANAVQGIVQARKAWFDFRIGQEAAIGEIAALERQFPNSAEIAYYKAEIGHKTAVFDAQECLLALEKAVRLEPTMAEAFALSSLIFHDMERENEMRLAMEKAEALGIVHNYAAVNLSKVYDSKGESKKALQTAQIALKDDEDTQFQSNYGQLLLANHQYEEAIEVFTKSLNLDGNNVESLESRAKAYALSGDSKKALADLHRAIAIQPENADLYQLRGELYTIYGDFKRALSDLNQAIHLEPKFAAAHYQRAKIFVEQRAYKKALPLLEEALQVAKSDASFETFGDLYNDLGVCASNLGQTSVAFDYYSEGIEQQPNGLLYENRANLYAEAAENREAISDYKKAFAYGNSNAENYFKLGSIQYVVADFNEATKSLTFAIRIKEKDGKTVPTEYYMKRGEALLALGGEHVAQAEEDFMRTAQGQSRNWKPLYYLGKCKYQTGEYDRAIKFFSDAIGINNQAAEIYDSRGDAFSMMEQYGSAALDYGAAASLVPEEICYHKKKGHANLRNESWLAAVEAYDDAIAQAKAQGYTIDVELYHGKGRAYTGKGYAEGSDLAYQLAIDNYKSALKSDNVSEKERYFIQLNMMTTYEKWGMMEEAEKMKRQLTRTELYREERVMTCG